VKFVGKRKKELKKILANLTLTDASTNREFAEVMGNVDPAVLHVNIHLLMDVVWIAMTTVLSSLLSSLLVYQSINAIDESC